MRTYWFTWRDFWKYAALPQFQGRSLENLRISAVPGESTQTGAAHLFPTSHTSWDKASKFPRSTLPWSILYFRYKRNRKGAIWNDTYITIFLQCWVFGMSWGCNAIKAERICTLKSFTLLMSLLKQETRSWWGGAAQASRTERHFVLLCRFPHNFPSFLVCRLMSRALRGALSPADPQTADEASREMSTETSQMRWLLPRVAMPPGIVSPSKIPKK